MGALGELARDARCRTVLPVSRHCPVKERSKKSGFYQYYARVKFGRGLTSSAAMVTVWFVTITGRMLACAT